MPINYRYGVSTACKASEIGKRLGLSRMDAYNSLKKLQEKGLVKATLDKPIRFFGMTINEVFRQIIRTKEMDLRRMNENLESLSKSGHFAITSDQPNKDEDSFSVQKIVTQSMHDRIDCR